MQQRINPMHEKDDQGRPAGGVTHVVIAEDSLGAPAVLHTLSWQKGPLMESGKRLPPNGLFVESVIAAAADRIRFYQESPFNCAENAAALGHLEAALEILQSRTKRREAAGIEGTHGIQPGHEVAAR